ncbi:hypothetical protein GCM10010215_36080 [Streptomyces virginiae]|uniref:Uncharacterized protein n=1 Tax=Streptomyces virginiae TaxID=1961 RepID=A0ABQ3NPU3_STRVG|nr:hypothetical protein GCM10010215_36080 [Streptomyces virginiae]GHI14786.1 hypothetical protein Scinn_42490 [Streptomyces virginiae]GLV92717.1 hypothetical protein Slala04_41710 [Streptomyces lavendulae subsp. lavendulae]
MTVTDDIGADQTSRRSSAPLFTVTDADGSLPHEAFVELGGSPAISVRLFSLTPWLSGRVRPAQAW